MLCARVVNRPRRDRAQSSIARTTNGAASRRFSPVGTARFLPGVARQVLQAAGIRVPAQAEIAHKA